MEGDFMAGILEERARIADLLDPAKVRARSPGEYADHALAVFEGLKANPPLDQQ